MSDLKEQVKGELWTGHMPEMYHDLTADLIIALVRADERQRIAHLLRSESARLTAQEARNGNAVWNWEETQVVEGEEGSTEEILDALASMIEEGEAQP